MLTQHDTRFRGGRGGEMEDRFIYECKALLINALMYIYGFLHPPRNPPELGDAVQILSHEMQKLS